MKREEEIRQEVARYLYEDFQPTGVITEDRLSIGIRCAQWADEHPKNPWISLNERVPEPKKRVLFLDNKGVAHFGYNNIDRKGATIFTTDANAPVITHWMPIPQIKK